MTAWGYARVSTQDQNPQLQIDALKSSGVEDAHLVIEHVSGAAKERPALEQLLQNINPGDTLTVWKLDRLGRTTSHLISVIDSLGHRGIDFRSLTDPIDTTTPAGRLVFRMMASLAEFERDLLIERTRAGLAAAKASGRTPGRKTVVSDRAADLIRQFAAEGMSQTDIATMTNVSPSTVGRLLRGEIASRPQAVAR